MADRGFPAPHDGFCDLCSKPIAAGDRVCLLDWSEWAHKACVDARPVSIPLPPEPPRDRVVEAVDQDGTVWMSWTWDSEHEAWRSGLSLYEFNDVVASGIEDRCLGWTLRHVAAESGEQ